MKTKYRLFIALLYGSYTIPVMFSYCFIGSRRRGPLFLRQLSRRRYAFCRVYGILRPLEKSGRKGSVHMSAITQAHRIVVKVGTSTLTYDSGRLNLRRVETLCKVLADLQNAGHQMVLVSSGAMGVGMGKAGIRRRPDEIARRQALAAVGQCELMFIYDKFFGEYNRTVAQVLMTADVLERPHSRRNVENTFSALMEMEIIPVVNENDTVAVDELEGPSFGDNDTLSAIVADLTDADLLVILTDIDGLYDSDPRQNPQARRIPYVPVITPQIEALAGGAGSSRGTGGMITKIRAARRVNGRGVPCCIVSGSDPTILYDLLAGRQVGTTFGGEER